MFHRFARILLEVVAGLVVIAIGAAGLAAWRLSVAPVSLAMLTPYIDEALEREFPRFDLTIGDTVVTWGGWNNGFDILLQDVRVRTLAGAPVLAVPEAEVRLSIPALFVGRIVPTRIVIADASFVLERAPDGKILLRGLAVDAPRPQAAPEQSGPEGTEFDVFAWFDARGPRFMTLREVVIRDAQIEFADPAAGALWRFVDANLVATLDEDGGNLSARVTMKRRDASARLAVQAKKVAARRELGVTLDFSDVRPGLFSDIHDAAAGLAALDAPLGGRIEFRLDERLRPVAAQANLTIGRGRIVEPKTFLEPVTIVGATAKGSWDGAVDRATLDAFEVDFGGPTLSASVAIEGVATPGRASGTVRIAHLPVDSLARYWPPATARSARKWIVDKLSAGSADEAEFDFALRAGAGGWADPEPEKLDGRVSVTGLTVNYLAPMPPVRGVSGRLTLGLDRVDIVIASGAIGAIVAEEGRIAITGLQGNDEAIDIQLTVKSPTRDVLALVDHRPLEFLKSIRFDPGDFSGETTARVRIAFPLLDRLKVDQIVVQGTAEQTGFGLRKAALGQDVRDGAVRLAFDEKGVHITGKVVFGRMPADVDYKIAFLSTAPEQQRLKASGRLPEGELKSMGFDPAPYLEGPLPVTVEYVLRRGGRAEVAIEAGLDDAVLSIPELGWSKPAKIAGSGRLDLVLQGERPVEIRSFRIAAGDLDAAGSMQFTPDGKSFARADLTRLRIGRTDVAGSVLRQGGGWRVQLQGKAIDVAAARSDISPVPAKLEASTRPRIDVSLKVGEVYVTADRSLTDVSFDAVRDARWEQVRLDARSEVRDGTREPFSLALETDRSGRQTFRASSPNAGAMLRGLGVTDNMVGGALTAEGATDETRPDRALAISARITNFRVVNPPVAARLLSIGLLTGIADSMRGEGMGFTRFDARVFLTEEMLEIADAAASGPALGLTLSGKLDFITGEIDTAGVIVPANSVNSLFSRIPLIGNILIGPGLFAATYTIRGPRSDPQVSVNALSALAPGILRRIFSGGGDGPPANANPLPGDRLPGTSP